MPFLLAAEQNSERKQIAVDTRGVFTCTACSFLWSKSPCASRAKAARVAIVTLTSCELVIPGRGRPSKLSSPNITPPNTRRILRFATTESEEIKQIQP